MRAVCDARNPDWAPRRYTPLPVALGGDGGGGSVQVAASARARPMRGDFETIRVEANVRASPRAFAAEVRQVQEQEQERREQAFLLEPAFLRLLDRRPRSQQHVGSALSRLSVVIEDRRFKPMRKR